jgi:hypothetical protein
MKSVQEITTETVQKIMKRGESYIWNILYRDEEDSPEKYIEDLRKVIKDHDDVIYKTKREMNLPSSEEFLNMIKDGIKDINVSDITSFKLSIETQNEFPPDGVTGHSYFNTTIPDKYFPNAYNQMINIDSFYSALIDYFSPEFIWEDSLTQGDLMSILGDKVVEFFKTTGIPFYWVDELIDWNEEFPDDIDLFFGENHDT